MTVIARHAEFLHFICDVNNSLAQREIDAIKRVVEHAVNYDQDHDEALSSDMMNARGK